MSTERQIREKIASAIESIAGASLGYQSARGNIKDYPLEHEEVERREDYLSAVVSSGARELRAWSVWVDSSETIRNVTGGLGNIAINRVYRVSVRGYYQQAPAGEGLKTLFDHELKVRKAIYLLDSRLGGLVDRLIAVSSASLRRESLSYGSIIVLERIYEYERTNPDF